MAIGSCACFCVCVSGGCLVVNGLLVSLKCLEVMCIVRVLWVGMDTCEV